MRQNRNPNSACFLFWILVISREIWSRGSSTFHGHLHPWRWTDVKYHFPESRLTYSRWDLQVCLIRRPCWAATTISQSWAEDNVSPFKTVLSPVELLTFLGVYCLNVHVECSKPRFISLPNLRSFKFLFPIFRGNQYPNKACLGRRFLIMQRETILHLHMQLSSKKWHVPDEFW